MWYLRQTKYYIPQCVKGKALAQVTKWICDKLLGPSAPGWQHLFPRQFVSHGQGGTSTPGHWPIVYVSESHTGIGLIWKLLTPEPASIIALENRGALLHGHSRSAGSKKCQPSCWSRSFLSWFPHVPTCKGAAGPSFGWLPISAQDNLRILVIVHLPFRLPSLGQSEKSSGFWCGSRCQTAKQSLQRNGYERHFVR